MLPITTWLFQIFSDLFRQLALRHIFRAIISKIMNLYHKKLETKTHVFILLIIGLKQHVHHGQEARHPTETLLEICLKSGLKEPKERQMSKL